MKDSSLCTYGKDKKELRAGAPLEEQMEILSTPLS